MSSTFHTIRRIISRQASSAIDPSLPNDSRASHILAVVGALTGCAAFSVVLRAYVRAWILRRLGTDDYVIFLAMACSFAVLGCFVGEFHHGLGKYTQYISLDDQEILRKFSFYHSIVVMVGISAVKISLGFFLLRVAAQSKFKKFIIAAIAFLIAFTIACAGTLIFQCIPVAAAWDLTLKTNAQCFSIHTFTAIGLFNTIINIITDVIFATIPIPMFYHIQVNKRTRASLMAILSLGYVACTAAIVKTVAQTKVLKTPNSYRESTFTMWNSIELNVGILAASLPTIKPLVKTILGTTRSLTSGPRTGKRTRDGYYIHHGSNFAMQSMKDKRPDAEDDVSRKYDVQVSVTRGSMSLERSDSEEILAGARAQRQGPDAGAAIMRTTEVIVQRDDRSGESDVVGGVGPRTVEDRI